MERAEDTSEAAEVAEAEAAEAESASVEAPEEAEAAPVEAPEGGPADDAGADDPVATLARERDEYLELAQRARAEFENYRKRSARDLRDAEQRGRAHVARGLVPAVDNLERALVAAGVELEPSDDPGATDPASREVSAHEALAAGVALVHREIVGALRAAGVESFDPLGERFDPVLHEALSARPATDGEEAGHVAETLQRGYSLGDVLIRPARVVVTS